ncbi:MAG: ABC transporter permease [Solirubrobacteraceae bacterium]|nr:ABC transporter permease [Solirubrobacteraceae bacterium]
MRSSNGEVAAMSTGRATMLVTRREFGERIRSRAFQISTATTVAIVAAVALAAGLLAGDGTREYTVAAQGSEAVAITEAARAAAPAFDARIEIERFDDAAQLRAAVSDERVDAAITGGALISKDSPDLELAQLLESAAREVRSAQALRTAGLSQADAQRALQPAPLQRSSLEGESDGREGLAFIASLLLYMQLIILGLAVATGVVEEKASRVVEVLMSAIPSRALLAGKIVGIGLIGLLQFTLIIFVGLLTASASGAIELGGADAGVLTVVFVWFVLGFLLWAAVYAISGVIVSRQEDLNSSSTPVTIALVGAYLLAFPAVADPGSTLAVVSSLVPFSSPIVMPVRVVIGDASGLEIAASLGLLALAIAILVPLGARIYDGAVLRMGKPLKMREALRAARTSR